MTPNLSNNANDNLIEQSAKDSGIAVDRFFMEFFHSELPRQWPEPPYLPATISSMQRIPTYNPADFASMPSRWTLVASLSGLLILGFWLSSTMMPQQTPAVLSATSAPDRLLNQARADGKWIRENAEPGDMNTPQR